MKKIIILITILSSYYMLSCEKYEGGCQDRKIYSFQITNSSSHKINLEAYMNDTDFCFKEIDIRELWRHQVEIADTMPHPFQGYNFEPWIRLIYDDTISICFKDSRNESPFDIGKKYNYKKYFYGKSNEYEYYNYTLTEADYQYALEHREENE